ncbi:hypothetical protein CHUAL_003790 [Chamberlinius hualienensis]
MKYVVLAALAIILLVNTVRAEEEKGLNSIHTESKRQGRTYELTSGFTTALSSLGTIGVLGLVLLGILLLPTILSVLFSGAIGKRAFDDGFHIDKPAILARLSMMQEAWEKFDVKDTQCRKRLVCEVHTLQTELGPTARSIVKVMDYISNAGRFNLPEPVNGMFKEYIEAMRAGKEFSDCTKYSSCPYSIATQYRSL